MKKKQKGFTLVEILIATALTAMAFASILFIIFYSQKAIKHSSEEAKIATEGRQSFLKISQLIRQASCLDSFGPNGISVTYTAVINSSKDTKTRKLTYKSSDHTIEYDPDTSTSGDEYVIANNIYPLPSPNDAIFQPAHAGEALEVNYQIVSTNNVDNLNKSFVVSGLIRLRNYE